MIVETARTWLGTPFKHQGRIKGKGVDCVGLVVGVFKEVGYAVKDRTNYGRQPAHNELRKALESHCTEVKDMQPGDILLMRFSTEPQHVAIYTGNSIIHAYEKAGGCVEHTMNDIWRKRIVGIYRG